MIGIKCSSMVKGGNNWDLPVPLPEVQETELWLSFLHVITSVHAVGKVSLVFWFCFLVLFFNWLIVSCLEKLFLELALYLFNI